MNKYQKGLLIDEYDETTLKLFMEKYEEFEGTLLWKEYQMARDNNEVTEMPITLDIRCQELIQAFMSKLK